MNPVACIALLFKKKFFVIFSKLLPTVGLPTKYEDDRFSLQSQQISFSVDTMTKQNCLQPVQRPTNTQQLKLHCLASNHFLVNEDCDCATNGCETAFNKSTLWIKVRAGRNAAYTGSNLLPLHLMAAG